MSLNAADFEFAATVPFRSARHAEVVYAALAVDPEFRPHEVERTLSLEGSNLRLLFVASSARMLRASVGTFLDLLALAVDTLETFQDSIRP
jgi:tRNA threonylcarbamoyladenosine modification (KEOPS) complex  Pcc1 subunit